jgi:hypothetical protein
MKLTGTIPNTAVVGAIKDHVSCEVGDEAVILQIKSGVYYGLNPVGTTVWNYLQEPRTVAQVLSYLLESYDVDCVRCQADLQELLAQLLRDGLIEVTSAVGE